MILFDNLRLGIVLKVQKKCNVWNMFLYLHLDKMKFIKDASITLNLKYMIIFDTFKHHLMNTVFNRTKEVTRKNIEIDTYIKMHQCQTHFLQWTPNYKFSKKLYKLYGIHVLSENIIIRCEMSLQQWNASKRLNERKY